VLLRHEQSSMSLGEYLVDQRVITQAVLQQALDLQTILQRSMQSMLERANAGALIGHEMSKASAA
jgi:hypothetical protein